MIIIESRRKSLESLKVKYPDAMIIDVTSKAQDEFVKFSPFYPNGGIPVPFTDGLVAVCVEGIWQGLKVFETADVDRSFFSKRDMKNLKRTVRSMVSVLVIARGCMVKNSWIILPHANSSTFLATSGCWRTDCRNWSRPCASSRRTNLWYC